MDDILLEVDLEWPGASLDALTWKDLQDFIRALTESVADLEPGVDVSRMIPLKIEDGSFKPFLRVPMVARRAVADLLAGPTKKWTAERWAAAEPLHKFLRNRGATMHYVLGRGKKRRVVVPDPKEKPPTVSGSSRFFVFVQDVGGGGKNPRATLMIGGTKRQVATVASESLLRKLGGLIWANAMVTLDYQMDPETGAMLHAQVRDVEAYQHKSLHQYVAGGGEINLASHYANTATLVAERESAR